MNQNKSVLNERALETKLIQLFVPRAWGFGAQRNASSLLRILLCRGKKNLITPLCGPSRSITSVTYTICPIQNINQLTHIFDALLSEAFMRASIPIVPVHALRRGTKH